MNDIEQQIELNDLVFMRAFYTQASISFSIISGGDGLARGAEVGWVDVHWPCSGTSEVYIRGSLPEGRLAFESLSALVTELMSRLGIPKHARTEVLFFKADNCITFNQGDTSDEDGFTDKIQTRRRFRLP